MLSSSRIRSEQNTTVPRRPPCYPTIAVIASSLRSPPAIDMTFLNEFYEEIETNPSALEACKLIIQQCMEAG
jgi:hypothetical protein